MVQSHFIIVHDIRVSNITVRTKEIEKQLCDIHIIHSFITGYGRMRRPTTVLDESKEGMSLKPLFENRKVLCGDVGK